MNLQTRLAFTCAFLGFVLPVQAQEGDVAMAYFVTTDLANVMELEEGMAGHVAWHADQNDPWPAWLRWRSARWKAWLCAFAAPGTVTPIRRSAPGTGSAPATTLASRPDPSMAISTRSPRPPGSSAASHQMVVDEGVMIRPVRRTR